LHIIAENSEYYLSEDNENWIFVNKVSGNTDYTEPKNESPKHPLVCVLKWGYKPVDINFLNCLSEKRGAHEQP